MNLAKSLLNETLIGFLWIKKLTEKDLDVKKLIFLPLTLPILTLDSQIEVWESRIKWEGLREREGEERRKKSRSYIFQTQWN